MPSEGYLKTMSGLGQFPEILKSINLLFSKTVSDAQKPFLCNNGASHSHCRIDTDHNADPTSSCRLAVRPQCALRASVFLFTIRLKCIQYGHALCHLKHTCTANCACECHRSAMGHSKQMLLDLKVACKAWVYSHSRVQTYVITVQSSRMNVPLHVPLHTLKQCIHIRHGRLMDSHCNKARLLQLLWSFNWGAVITRCHGIIWQWDCQYGVATWL